jgi:hypothetical protein
MFISEDRTVQKSRQRENIELRIRMSKNTLD